MVAPAAVAVCERLRVTKPMMVGVVVTGLTRPYPSVCKAEYTHTATQRMYSAFCAHTLPLTAQHTHTLPTFSFGSRFLPVVNLRCTTVIRMLCGGVGCALLWVSGSYIHRWLFNHVL